MPTVFVHRGFRFSVYLNDYAPPHVHAFKSGGETVVNIGDELTKPYVRENRGMNNREQRQALKTVAENQNYFLAEWRRING